MEIFLNTNYQSLFHIPSFQILYHCRQPLNQSNFVNRENSQCSLADKKIGFVPFKIPEEKHIINQKQDPKHQGTSSLNSSLLSSEDSSLSIKQFRKNKKGPYRKYTLEQKIKVIKILNSGKDLKSVSNYFDIPRRNLLRWRKNGCQRKEGGGRPTDSVMETTLSQMLKKGAISSQKEITEIAKKLSSLKNFKASKGWFVKFCRRYQIDPHSIGIQEKQNI